MPDQTAAKQFYWRTLRENHCGQPIGREVALDELPEWLQKLFGQRDVTVEKISWRYRGTAAGAFHTVERIRI